MSLRLDLVRLLDFDRSIQFPIEVIFPELLEQSVPLFDAVQLSESVQVVHRDLHPYGLLESLFVQLGHLQPPVDGRLAESGLLADLLRRIAEIHHHLESLGLLEDGQILPLHIFFEHGRDLLFVVHVGDHTRQLDQARGLRRFEAPVPDHDQILRPVEIRHDGQVLIYAVLPDGLCQLRQISQVFPRVLRMMLKIPDRDHDDLALCHPDHLPLYPAPVHSMRWLVIG